MRIQQFVISKTKQILGIKDVSLLIKNIKRRIGKLIYHKKYSAEDIVNVMVSMGMKKGSLICIHSSMKEFYNYNGTAQYLIKAILCVITEEGTLMMPAFPKYEFLKDPNYVFDPGKDATGAGYLAEVFRRYPGVKRSINVKHSVCAIGKHADYLVKDHHTGYDCWDECSPWQRMMGFDALVFNLGMPRSYIGTFDHCVESILRDTNSFWGQFFTTEMVFRYFDSDHTVQEYRQYAVDGLYRRTKENQVTKYFADEDWQIQKISNLEIKVFYTNKCFQKMINLGKKGITIYKQPNAKDWQW